MEQRSTVPYILTLAFAVISACLRLWSLLTSVDSQGLPAMHLSLAVFFASAVVFLAVSLVCAIRSPGRSGKYRVLQYGRAGQVCGIAAGAVLLLSAVLRFAEELQEGATIVAPILVLLGLIGGICCMVAAKNRSRNGKPIPAAEVFPAIYLLLNMLFQFKDHWSTDPIILDYCVALFAQIFALLAFYFGAGFVFDLGKPRRALFFAMGAVFFAAAAILDSVFGLSLAGVLLYTAVLLWQLPMIWDLLESNPPDPKPEKK